MVKPDHLFLRAKALLRAGDARMAASLLDEASRLDPTFGDAIEAQGELFDAMGDASAATERYELARRLRGEFRPGAPDRHFVWRHDDSVIASTIAYSSVIKSLRKHALPYIARGNSFLAGGEPGKALADYEQALKLKPGDSDIRAMMGECLVALGRYADAVRNIDTVLEARPQNAEALSARAIARMALGQVAAANEDWLLQLSLLRGRAPASAYVALRLADHKRALPYLEKAAQAQPHDPYWAVYQRTALLRLGRTLAPLDGQADAAWPGPLLAFQSGEMSADQLLAVATTPSRQAEALLQVGVAEFGRDRSTALGYWQRVVDTASPVLVEFACARNEITRVAR